MALQFKDRGATTVCCISGQHAGDPLESCCMGLLGDQINMVVVGVVETTAMSNFKRQAATVTAHAILHPSCDPVENS